MRRAIWTLFGVSICVAVMATLAATAADKIIVDVQDDVVAIKYPQFSACRSPNKVMLQKQRWSIWASFQYSSPFF
jgi:hypothetical protein